MTRPIRHAFVVRDPAIVSPFEQPAGDAWLIDRTVRERSRFLLESHGMAVDEVATLADAEAAAASIGGGGGSIVVVDSVAFSPKVLRSLIAVFGSSTAPAIQAALPVAVATRRLSHIDGLQTATIDGADVFTAPLYAIAPGGRIADAAPTLLPYAEKVHQFPVPIGMTGEASATIGISESWMCRIDHWVHVQRVNIAALTTLAAEHTQGFRNRLWVLWRCLAAFPWTGGRLTTSLRWVHPTAKIHHTAHVSASVIDAGAVIGPRAIVNASYIGKGAHIEAGGHVELCVVGPGAAVSSLSGIRASVIYPRAFAAQLGMQLSVLGEGSVAFTGSYFQDLNFLGNVKVMHRGKTVDAGDRFVGVCLGPWARIGGALWVTAGREIPAGALVVMDPRTMLSKTNEEMMRDHIVTSIEGRLVPLGPMPSNRPPGSRPALPAGSAETAAEAAPTAQPTAALPAPAAQPTAAAQPAPAAHAAKPSVSPAPSPVAARTPA